MVLPHPYNALLLAVVAFFLGAGIGNTLFIHLFEKVHKLETAAIHVTVDW